MLTINNTPYNLQQFFHKKTKRGIFLLIMLLDYLNIWVPRFCYHDKLSASGNCRMCLVEVKGSLKPLVACCTIINNSMVVYTNTDLVRRSREYIMEFLLINHPLDCPICDQAGECDLQDLSLTYGSDDSRFQYKKKAILNKNIGSLIKTNMNRCIYCTRCVRYTSELNNNYMFNTLGRGGLTEIGNYYFTDNIDSFINGNVIDLCPVGALTAKPYSFRSRTWEFISIESIDILDSLCSNIRIDTRNNVVERILPKPNDNINEEWITDKIRFCYDGFKKQRLSWPFYKKNIIHRDVFVLCSWFLIFHKIKLNYNINYNSFFNNQFFHIYTGHLIDLFSLYTLKMFSSVLGINNINQNLNLNVDLRKYFIFNNNIKSFEHNNLFLILGTNPKLDSPILNMNIRHLKYKFNKKIKLFYVGSKVLLNYSFTHLGINSETFVKLLYGKSFFCKIVKNVYNIICLFSIGINLFFNNIISLSLDLLSFFLKKQNFICNFLSLFSSDVSIYELGIHSYYFSKSHYINNSNIKMYYLLGVDFRNMELNNRNSTFNIYHGHHGNIGLSHSDIVLPSNNFIENTCFFLNCEGRFFVSNVAITKKKKIINNESIIYNLFNFLFTDVKNSFFLKHVFFFFFYKNNLFFTKFKHITLFHISIKNHLNHLFLKNYFFSLENSFYEMDVFNRSSYYILKMKENLKSSNFL